MFDSEYRVHFPNHRIFISRNHNWAFSAWEIGIMRNYIKPGSAVVHIDAHLDFCDPNTYKNINSEQEAINFASTLNIDEFIIPALKSGTISTVYMISDDQVKIKNESKVKRAYSLNHYEQAFRQKWFEETEDKSVILDLDLDFFNKNYFEYNANPILLSDLIIREQLENIRKSMWEWDMVTVALSPEFCGGNDASMHLFNLFLDVFELDINESIPW